jgi:hypothetical protein
MTLTGFAPKFGRVSLVGFAPKFEGQDFSQLQSGSLLAVLLQPREYSADQPVEIKAAMARTMGRDLWIMETRSEGFDDGREKQKTDQGTSAENWDGV